MANILTTLVSRQTRKYADRPAVYRRDPQGQWIAYSWNEMAAMVDQASCALEILGINETEKIAVFSANNPNVLITDFAAFANAQCRCRFMPPLLLSRLNISCVMPAPESSLQAMKNNTA